MKRVIDNAKLKNNNPIGNLNKMVRSIYAYKSSMNFQNKMKIINNQSKKWAAHISNFRLININYQPLRYNL
jgi:hypothetical protein